MSAIKNRYEFVLLFDVVNGNPNGDPDAGNIPRTDPETGHGIVSDVCLKRKVRNYVSMARADEDGYAIYVEEGSVLNDQHRKAYVDVRQDAKVDAAKLSPKDDAEAARLTGFMCANFFDVRTFGAVMGTSINCGQVRGPVQIAFARSVEPILPQEITITRMAATNEAEKTAKTKGNGDGEDIRRENRTMGNKYIVPYGLYRVHGFVSANLAGKTGFSEDDLNLLWQALVQMFEHDHSAARGEMSARRLIVFRHQSHLGNARASDLFDLVTVVRMGGSELPARSYKDYTVSVDKDTVPAGVELMELL